MKKLFSGLGALALVVALVGCVGGGSPSDTPAATNLYCVVSDGGGFDDKSFNESAKNGVEQAHNDFGAEFKAIESVSAEDYAPNINSAIEENCSIIFTIGFNLVDATKEAATANPDVQFAVIDDSSIDLPNVKSVAYNTHEAGYLAGYLSAGISKTGTVATFGGMAIPSVQIFSDGYYQGVEAYNAAKGTSVKVLGWDATDPNKYTVVGGDGAFTDQSKGMQISQQFVDQGADIILPVAGAAGFGAAQVAAENGVKYIWVDVDGYNTNDSAYWPYLLTSVMKNIQTSVYDICKEHNDTGTFAATTYIGTIANGGVDIAPYHDLDAEVSAELKAEIEKIRDDLKSGALTITSQFSPAS
jgi:basic membrane protein A